MASQRAFQAPAVTKALAWARCGPRSGASGIVPAPFPSPEPPEGPRVDDQPREESRPGAAGGAEDLQLAKRADDAADRGPGADDRGPEGVLRAGEVDHLDEIPFQVGDV